MSPYTASLIRGAIGGAFVSGTTFFAAAPSQGPLTAFYAAGGAFCLYMAARFAEGAYDANKAKIIA